jgi:hypothetical protein
VSFEESSKVLITYGEPIMIRDFILNSMKNEHNLVVQVISGTRRRNANAFKLQIFEGSQCNAAYYESGEFEGQARKVLFFEDIDVVFRDESEFYFQLVKLL